MTELGRNIDEDILLRVEPDHPGDTRIILSNDATSICRLVGSSNGLVCLMWWTSQFYYPDFLIVNPSTGEVKELVSLPKDYMEVHVEASGFGYDSSIDDFKVVIGHRSLPNDLLSFSVLELKTNIWRSVDFEEEDYDCLEGNGILCNGAIHWLYPDNYPNHRHSVIVSFDLSTEVFKKIPQPTLNKQWTLGTMKDRLCVFRFPNKNLKEIEMWVMRKDQVSWEPTLPTPGYDANKTTTLDYIPNINPLPGHVHIWLLEEGSGAPVLVRSIEHSHNEYINPRYNEHIRLSTYSECNYNYDKHVFVKSLVSPHGGRAKIKRQSLVSSDYNGNGRREDWKLRERESHVFHSSNKGRATTKSQSLVSSDSNHDGRSVERKWRVRESHILHSSDNGRAKSQSQSLVASANHDRRRVDMIWKERESHLSHSSDKRRANSQSLVSSANHDGRRVERIWRERASHAFHNSDNGRAKNQSLVSSANHGRRRVERIWKERESHVFHSSDKGIANNQSLVASANHDGRRVERIWKERESHVFHSSDKGITNSQSLVASANHDGRRVERIWRERASHVFQNSDKGRPKSQSLVSSANHDGRRVERIWREKESQVFHSSDKGRAKSKSQGWKESEGEEGDDNGKS